MLDGMGRTEAVCDSDSGGSRQEFGCYAYFVYSTINNQCIANMFVCRQHPVFYNTLSPPATLCVRQRSSLWLHCLS